MDQIDGKLLRVLLTRLGKRQVQVANETGMDRFTLCRWCKGGVREVQKVKLQVLARGLGMSTDELLAQIRPKGRASEGGLSPAEAAMLEAFRSLSPIEQAKVLVAFDEAVNRVRSSPGSRSR